MGRGQENRGGGGLGGARGVAGRTAGIEGGLSQVESGDWVYLTFTTLQQRGLAQCVLGQAGAVTEVLVCRELNKGDTDN